MVSGHERLRSQSFMPFTFSHGPQGPHWLSVGIPVGVVGSAVVGVNEVVLISVIIVVVSVVVTVGSGERVVSPGFCSPLSSPKSRL